MPQKFDAVIFDMDGTLFQSETLVIPAFHNMFDQLRKEGLYTGDIPPDERLLSCLGMVLDDIWERLLPGSSDELKKRADELFLQFELKGLEQGEGELYPEVKETLVQLRQQGYRLFVASNGLEVYIDQIVKHKGLSGLFDGLYSAGKYNTSSKVDLVKLLIDQHDVRAGVMVGDRSSDVEAGKANGLKVIGCGYAGFGKEEELNGADEMIPNFSALLQWIENA